MDINITNEQKIEKFDQKLLNIESGKREKLWQGPLREKLIPLLQNIQNDFGYISEGQIEKIGNTLGVSIAEIYGVITFYQQFRLKPVGKYIIKVCDGTACHVNHSLDLVACLENILGVDDKNDTTKDQLFTVQKVACIGCCSLAPVITVNDQTYGRLNPNKLKKIIESYQNNSTNSESVL